MDGTFEGPATEGGKICVVLLNPSSSDQPTVSVKNVERVIPRLGFGSFEIVNLVDIPTKNSKSLAAVANTPEIWLGARNELTDALARADDLLFGWGHAPLQGPANGLKRMQTLWLYAEAERLGHTHAWMMNGLPRHPSRWHQYVGPQRGLISGGDFATRAVAMLDRWPMRGLLAGHQDD